MRGTTQGICFSESWTKNFRQQKWSIQLLTSNHCGRNILSRQIVLKFRDKKVIPYIYNLLWTKLIFVHNHIIFKDSFINSSTIIFTDEPLETFYLSSTIIFMDEISTFVDEIFRPEFHYLLYCQFFMAIILSLGVPKNSQRLLVQVTNPSIMLSPLLLLKFYGSLILASPSL